MDLKNLLPVFFVICFSSLFFGLTISYPSEISLSSAWTASFNFSGDSFSKATILIDDSEIINLFPSYSSLIIDTNPANSSYFISGSSSSPSVFTGAFSGLAEGKHILKVKLYSGSELSQEIEKEILSFAPASESDVSSIESKVIVLDDKSALTQATVSAQAQKISVLESELENKQTIISGLQMELEDLEVRYNSTVSSVENLGASLSAKLNDVENGLMTNEEFVSDVDERLSNFLYELEQEKKSNPFSGFVSFSSTNPLAVLFLLVVILVVVVSLVARKKGWSITSSIYNSKLPSLKFGSKSNDSSDSQKTLSSFEQDDDEGVFKGKWSWEN